MNKQNKTNIKHLMELMTDNSIMTSLYLSSIGFSHNSLFGYKSNGWLDDFGRGAYCKHGQNPPLEAALSALHLQLKRTAEGLTLGLLAGVCAV